MTMNETTSRELLGEGRFLRLVREGRWEYAQRTHSADAVVIVPWKSDGSLVLVEQFRVPVHGNVIEFPAGIVGDEAAFRGEPIEAAARRELLEETGYDAQQVTRVFAGTCSAGLTDEFVTFCLATGLQRRSAGGGVDGENIKVHEIPRSELDAWLQDRVQHGIKVDARLFTGIYLLDKFLAR
jgi:ADP-ribose pyrophosphatase